MSQNIGFNPDLVVDGATENYNYKINQSSTSKNELGDNKTQQIPPVLAPTQQFDLSKDRADSNKQGN